MEKKKKDFWDDVWSKHKKAIIILTILFSIKKILFEFREHPLLTLGFVFFYFFIAILIMGIYTKLSMRRKEEKK